MYHEDLAKPTKKQIKRTPKHNLMYPEVKSKMFMVRCGSCFELTICYSHSQLARTCVGCGSVIMTPSGGKGIVSEGCAIKSAEKHFQDLQD